MTAAIGWLPALSAPAAVVHLNTAFQDLVLEDALLAKGQWRVRLLARYQTSPQMLSDPCRVKQTRQLVAGEPVIIVGCFNGGSDQESFVAVLGFNPGVQLPEVLLAIDCGVTGWVMRGSSLVIESSKLQSGAAIPSPRHRDVSFTWQQDGQAGSILPAQAYGSVGHKDPASRASARNWARLIADSRRPVMLASRSSRRTGSIQTREGRLMRRIRTMLPQTGRQKGEQNAYLRVAHQLD